MRFDVSKRLMLATALVTSVTAVLNFEWREINAAPPRAAQPHTPIMLQDQVERINEEIQDQVERINEVERQLRRSNDPKQRLEFKQELEKLNRNRPIGDFPPWPSLQPHVGDSNSPR